MNNSDTTCDVLVVGGGMAGLSAAMSAVEHGARTVVMERAEKAGGNAMVAAGMFLGTTDFARLSAYIPDGNPALLRAFCADYSEALSWLENHQLPLGPAMPMDFRSVRPMGLGQPGDRHTFMNAMVSRAKAVGVTIETGTTVRDLAVTRNGISAEVIGPQGSYTVSPERAVVLASGGFPANRALLEKYLGRSAQFLKIRSLPGAVGDGLSLAQKIGAKTNGDLTAFYGHTMPDCPLEPGDWIPLTPYFARIGVLVNRNGRRFVDESASLLEELNPQAGYKQPDGKFWLLFDERIRLGEPLSSGVGNSPSVLPAQEWIDNVKRVKAPLVEARSLDDLIAQLKKDGVDTTVLTAEIRGYNAACREDRAASMIPPKQLNAGPLEVPPFYALRCVAAITATCGGIAIDDGCRVLDLTDKPLPGVFAAGVDAGGVYGKTYGGFLSWALISGRRAGKAAAEASFGAR